jgi:AcrR family transcriptional regulator
MSLSAVAQEAGTTRQALYRRWPDKASLAAAAIQSSAESDVAEETGDPLRDLERELADFQRVLARPGQLSMVGTMLQQCTTAESRGRYQACVIMPRQQRIRAILERALRLGLIDSAADLEVAVTMPTGAWYARELAGEPAPPDWPLRTAALIWRAVGGRTTGQ